jgi:hypothetical protein
MRHIMDDKNRIGPQEDEAEEEVTLWQLQQQASTPPTAEREDGDPAPPTAQPAEAEE